MDAQLIPTGIQQYREPTPPQECSIIKSFITISSAANLIVSIAITSICCAGRPRWLKTSYEKKADALDDFVWGRPTQPEDFNITEAEEQAMNFLDGVAKSYKGR